MDTRFQDADAVNASKDVAAMPILFWAEQMGSHNLRGWIKELENISYEGAILPHELDRIEYVIPV
jgi:hypothetical protein